MKNASGNGQAHLGQKSSQAEYNVMQSSTEDIFASVLYRSSRKSAGHT